MFVIANLITNNTIFIIVITNAITNNTIFIIVITNCYYYRSNKCPANRRLGDHEKKDLIVRGGNRTRDRRISGATLYQVSYCGTGETSQ